jgi:hypothetical protein
MNRPKVLSCFADLAAGWGPDRRRLGPHQCGGSNRWIKGIRQNPAGARFDADSLNIATQDGKRVTIGFGQDPGQAGKSQAQHLLRALSGFSVRPGWFLSALLAHAG